MYRSGLSEWRSVSRPSRHWISQVSVPYWIHWSQVRRKLISLWSHYSYIPSKLFSCGEVVNPCGSGVSPCKNGAACQPLQLGRYRCICLPGWSGPNCEVNIGKASKSTVLQKSSHGLIIDDCAEKPCALNSTCHDGVNDFTCDCPPGFGGKRCHLKQDLCSPNPCVHGRCVDRLFRSECICEPGWTGE